MKACQICLSPHRQAVDDALMAGTSVREIAATLGVGKSSIGRHRTGCLQPKIAAAARIVTPPVAEVRAEVARAKAIAAGTAPASYDDVLSLTSLLTKVAASLSRLEGACSTAASDGLHMPLAALSGQLHKGIETAAKLQGMYAEPQGAGGPSLHVTFNIPQAGAAQPTPRTVALQPQPAEVIDAEPVSLSLQFPNQNSKIY
jgi:hypothetical protein